MYQGERSKCEMCNWCGYFIEREKMEGRLNLLDLLVLSKIFVVVVWIF